MARLFAEDRAVDFGVIPPANGGSIESRLSVTDVEGVGFEAGATYGEAESDLIHLHLSSVLDRARRRKNLSEGQLYERTSPFVSHVRKTTPHIADEIEGIAKGADLPTEAAWLLQLRAEVFRIDPSHLPKECTSFGAGPIAGSRGTIAGQNADLPPFYRDILVLLRRRVSGQPTVLTLTPAGQVGWHGMNSAGVAVFANFLYSDGWRPGVPRYLFTRIALEFDSARGAATQLISMHRGSSRNLLLADDDEVLDLELAVDEYGLVEAEDGLLVHANHHVSEIEGLERASESYLRNSRRRHERMAELLRSSYRELDVPTAVEMLRDRSGMPDVICRAPGDATDDDDTITVASTVADVAERRLWIAIGPPHEGTYHEYEV